MTAAALSDRIERTSAQSLGASDPAAWHLASERKLKLRLAGLLAEHARLADFLEKKASARIDQIRATLTIGPGGCGKNNIRHPRHALNRS